jgi:aryl-alcohol dehydrogenase-like predicted oxidoreductase
MASVTASTELKRRLLGTTGLSVSEVGFGSWAIGGPFEVGGVPLGWSNTSDEDSMIAIRRARDLGVNFFDTSDIYGLGRSESLLGIVLSRTREKVIISTKVGNVRTKEGEFRKDFSKKHIFYAIDGSLKRLRTDYVDLYQVHNPTVADLEGGDVQEAMEMLQETGKIRFWGISVTTPQDGIAVVRRGWGHTLQVLYNILNQEPENELFPMAMERGYGIIARVPLASGLLSGKYQANTVFPANDVRQGFLTEKRLREAMGRVDEVKGIVSGHCRSLGEAALRFVLAHDAVSTVIPGARNGHQVELNVAAARDRLPPDVLSRLRDRLGDYNFYARHAIRV